MNVPLKQYWDLLANYIKPQRARFALLTILLLSSIGLQIVNPQIMRYFIDTATLGQATGSLALAALAFIGIALLQQVAGIGATYHVIVLKDGRVEAEGRLDELLETCEEMQRIWHGEEIRD